ncbi:MAG: hypothetical protein H6779_00085 [Candidatus Nomurabacteria bacterium]|nr:MAG: hypothetical protein H6779_00085 [Candidatus Nomurabacteria bacterium]
MSKKIINNSVVRTKTKAKSIGRRFIRAPVIGTDKTVIQTVPLYRYVYSSRYSLLVVFWLLVSLFMQGIQLAYANEDTLQIENEAEVQQEESPVQTATEPVTDSVAEEEELVEPKEENIDSSNDQENILVDEPEPAIEEEYTQNPNPSAPLLQQQTKPDKSTETTEPTNLLLDSDVLEGDDTILNLVTSESELTASGTVLDINKQTTTNETPSSSTLERDTAISTEISSATTNTNLETSTPSNNSEQPVDSTDQVKDLDTSGSGNNGDSSSDNLDKKIIKELNNSTTTESEFLATTGPVQETKESVSIVQSDSDYAFNKSECTEVADGSFYCHQPKATILDDALFSAPDADGDLEIFVVREGQQTQVTHNKIDDASPYYDSKSNTIVWHRLINDRFQIISYDLETGEEEQITTGKVNNMEPTRQGKYIVWQRWINNSWNIVLFNGEEEIPITADDSHNISPHIQGSLIIWNKHTPSGDKKIQMYNLDSQSYVTVNDPDGLTVDNPRMVLVYDSLHANGDIITKGFDIMTGEFIDLDTLPRKVPEIPDSESTPETRALIQAKPEIEHISKDKAGSVPLDQDPDQIENLEQSTSTTVPTLDLSTGTSTNNISTTSDGTIEDIKDLEISSLVTDEELAKEERVEAIPDLEIPPFETEDTQSISQGIATSTELVQ